MRAKQLQPLLRRYATTLYQLCSNSTSEQFDKLVRAVPLLVDLIQISDAKVLTDASLAIRHLIHPRSPSQIDILIKADLLVYLERYISTRSSKATHTMRYCSLRIISKLAHSCNIRQAKLLLNHEGMSDRLIELVLNRDDLFNIAVRREALLAIVNICLPDEKRESIARKFCKSTLLFDFAATTVLFSGADSIPELSSFVTVDPKVFANPAMIKTAQRFVVLIVLSCPEAQLAALLKHHFYPALLVCVADYSALCGKLCNVEGHEDQLEKEEEEEEEEEEQGDDGEEVEDDEDPNVLLLHALEALLRLVSRSDETALQNSHDTATRELGNIFNPAAGWEAVQGAAKAVTVLGTTAGQLQRIAVAAHLAPRV